MPIPDTQGRPQGRLFTFRISDQMLDDIDKVVARRVYNGEPCTRGDIIRLYIADCAHAFGASVTSPDGANPTAVPLPPKPVVPRMRALRDHAFSLLLRALSAKPKPLPQKPSTTYVPTCLGSKPTAAPAAPEHPPIEVQDSVSGRTTWHEHRAGYPLPYNRSPRVTKIIDFVRTAGRPCTIQDVAKGAGCKYSDAANGLRSALHANCVKRNADSTYETTPRAAELYAAFTAVNHPTSKEG